MFKVQRHILATYHVTDPQDFYKGTDFWRVPEDPADTDHKQPPYRLSVQLPPEEESADGPTETPEAPVFSLTSVYVPTGRANLASFISVNSEAADEENFGKMRILRLPNATQVQGPSQIANTFDADDRIQRALQ